MEFNILAKDLKPVMDDAKKILNPKSNYGIAKVIHCSLVGNELTACITDTFRVNKHKVKLDTDYGFAFFTIPYTKLASKDKEVHVIVGKEKVTYYIDEKEIEIPMEEVEYVDLEEKTKTEYKHSFKINPKFLIDALHNIKGDTVSIELSDSILRVDGKNVVMLKR